MAHQTQHRFGSLRDKAQWLRIETLKIHKNAPGTRLASSLSCIEILTVLYYAKVLRYDCRAAVWDKRDRFIVSKGHGAIGLYPLLADLGFFPKDELVRVCADGAMLGNIPDCNIPGIESINGSLGHGLGVSCGMAVGLKALRQKAKVFTMVGDGELYEGSNWEAIMFAGHHKLDNLVMIVDNNKKTMLGPCKKIIDWGKLEDKFAVFGWKPSRVDGHDCAALLRALTRLKNDVTPKPKVLICDTIKGKGVKCLENDDLCHVKSLTSREVDRYIDLLTKEARR